MQEPVEAQVALAEHRRRREIDDRLLIEPLRNRHAGADAIEVDCQRMQTCALQLRHPIGRAHQPGDVEILLQPQRQPLADIAAAGNEDMTAPGLH